MVACVYAASVAEAAVAGIMVPYEPRLLEEVAVEKIAVKLVPFLEETVVVVEPQIEIGPTAVEFEFGFEIAEIAAAEAEIAAAEAEMAAAVAEAEIVTEPEF